VHLKRRLFFILFCFIFSLSADICHGGAVLYLINQKKAHRHRPTQAEYQQHQQQTGEQGQGAPEQPTYQQTVDQRNQAIAQAILAAHNQSITSDSVPFGNSTEIDEPTAQAVNPGASQQRQFIPQAGPVQVKDTVDLAEVWKKLDTTSTVWPLLIDDQAKVITVSEYIDRFQKQGVKINEPPEHYVQMIDQITGANPQMLQRSFGELIQIVAIVDYDFDNGMDKDELARKILGDAGFEANKRRFTQAAEQQQQQPSGN